MFLVILFSARDIFLFLNSEYKLYTQRLILFMFQMKGREYLLLSSETLTILSRAGFIIQGTINILS